MKSRILVAAICLTALAFIAGCPKLNIPGNLAGQVLNEAGQGQGYVSVAVVDAETGHEAGRLTAEDSGSFFFEKVDAGTYLVKTYSMSGKELPNDCQPVKLGAGRTINVVVTLLPQDSNS